MQELEFDWLGYAHSTGSDGHPYLHHQDGGSWRVAYTIEELVPGVEAFYSKIKSRGEINLRVICQFTDLKSLVLEYCEIDSLPPEIGQLAHLTTLNLHENKLTALPSEIGQLVHLTALNLRDNKLSTLPPEVGQLSKLTSLDLSVNQLAIFPAEIIQMTQLKQLYLFWNKLTAISPAIGQLTELTNLNLADNPLTTLPVEIGNLKNLHMLDLSGKDFSNLDFSRFVHLERLGFMKSAFWLLPQNMHCLTNLKVLDLIDCELHQIPQEVKSLQVENLSLLLMGNPIPKEEIEALRKERPGWNIWKP